MKIWSLLFITAFLLNHLYAQKTTGDIYIFKKDGNQTTDVKEASFLQHVFPLNDTTYVSRYYNFTGPMITQESYRDKNLTIPYGRFCWYNASGKIDSSGMVKNGKKDGLWEYMISKKEKRVITYENGIKIKEETYHYDDNGKYITADTSHSDEDENPTQKAAEYKNGINDWTKYIQKNLHTPERLQNVLKEGTYHCVVNFLVDKEGYTRDIYMMQSSEWSSDAEAMRLITASPQWHPALQSGRTVFYRQLQPITYNVQSR